MFWPYYKCHRTAINIYIRLTWVNLALKHFYLSTVFISGVTQGACGPAELTKFQAVLPDFQIQVFAATSQVELLFRGPEAKHIIYLVLDENAQHYNVISGM